MSYNPAYRAKVTIQGGGGIIIGGEYFPANTVFQLSCV